MIMENTDPQPRHPLHQEMLIKVAEGLLGPGAAHALSTGGCPICKETINPDDFEDPLSEKEYKISGLCQACQDEVFK